MTPAMTPETPFTAASLLALARRSLIVPVLVIDDPASAVPLARALRDAGLPMLEVTLRTPAALLAIREMRTALPDLVVGAGTVRSPHEAAAAQAAGAQFAVSPGYTADLGRYAREHQWPLLPGVATASEVMVARDDGFDFLKLFPAAACGGIALLDALHGPFPDLAFCPTGGIDGSNAAHYLALPNVACVGGSWVAPRALTKAGDWSAISVLAAQAVASLQPFAGDAPV